jgi:hypothetical protein
LFGSVGKPAESKGGLFGGQDKPAESKPAESVLGKKPEPSTSAFSGALGFGDGANKKTTGFGDAAPANTGGSSLFGGAAPAQKPAETGKSSLFGGVSAGAEKSGGNLFGQKQGEEA